MLKLAKRITLFGIIFLLIGCAGSAPPAETSAPNSIGMTLDQALKEAADRIDERITAGSKIAPLNFNSPHDKFSSYVLDELTANLVDSRRLTVVDRKEVDLIRGEFDFQFSGEVGDDSMQELGRMLGAQAIISGSLTDMGDFFRIVIRVLNVQNASVEVQYRANIDNDKILAALMTGGKTETAVSTPQRTATQTTVAPATAPVATPAPSSAPAHTPAPTVTPTPPPAQAATPAPAPATIAPIPTQAAAPTSVPEPAPTPPPPTVYRVGDAGPAGGIIFYDKGNNTNGWRYLEAASRDAGSVVWGTNNDISGTRVEIGAGKQNTQIIVNYMMESGNNQPAAQTCRQYRQGGYDDWFLPSKAELNLMYWNLKQQSLGGLGSGWYWSSSNASNYYASTQSFGNGNQGDAYKSDVNSIRPIRAF